MVQRSGDELKLVWPQAGIDPAVLEALAALMEGAAEADGFNRLVLLSDQQMAFLSCAGFPGVRR